jgi:hypothetical protein
MDKKRADVAKIAYTLLACNTYIAPKLAGGSVPDELLECVLVPDDICKYD